MVEGPGCTLNGEKIRARVLPGQAVTEVRGSALQSLARPVVPLPASAMLSSAQDAPLNTNKDTKQDFLKMFHGCYYSGVETLGKELFMYFGPKALRNSAESQQRIRMMEELDVCSPKFSLSRAESEVKKQKSRMLCDTLMDQKVLPGVGNIIKNEALFDCGLHPAVQCNKSGSAISKHYKVYKRSNCARCCSKITVCRLGENNRMTYFCPHCQKENPQDVDICELPSRSTGFSERSSGGGHLLDSVARRSEEQWTCVACTLINTPSSLACAACLTLRPIDSILKNEENSIPFNNLVKYPCNNFGKPSTEVKINRKTVFGTTTLVLSDFSNKSNTLERKKSQNYLFNVEFQSPSCMDAGFSDVSFTSEERTGSRNQLYHKVNASPTVCSGSKLLNPVYKKMKTTHDSSPDLTSQKPGLCKSELQRNVTDGSPTLNAATPRCSKHNRLCVLRVVRKDGENRGRQFYACPLPREAQCGFFKWADLSFPLCNHGKRSIMRTVLKIGPNNGRNFFVCPFGKEKQCNFFQWAENGPGIKIIPGC